MDASSRFSVTKKVRPRPFRSGTRSPMTPMPDLLVCIHANSDPESSGSGFECYPAPPGRKYHPESYNFAEMLVEEFSALGMTIRGENGIRYAYYDDNNEKYLVESSNSLVFTDPVLWDAGKDQGSGSTCRTVFRFKRE